MLNLRTRMFRRFFRIIGRNVLRLFTRTTIEGREHMRTPGPVIFAANHTSTFDAVLLLLLMPLESVFIGPGDFRLLWPSNWFMRNMGLILMKRGAVDREGLRRMTELLKAGGALGMFPEGGTWEKPISDVKSGASYMSYTTGARVVPMAYGGTYQVWRRMVTLRFPCVTIRIAPPEDPVTITERKRRQEELQDHAHALMATIYAMLSPETQAHYDRQARLSFAGSLRCDPLTLSMPHCDLSALAELVAKPNLFSPLYWNARLPVRPLVRYGRWFPARRMRVAVEALLTAFGKEGEFSGYLEYRLGDTQADAIRVALAAIRDALDTPESAGARVLFDVTVTDSADRV
ncbi:MAG: 1-acyl-sn-glycerol-3-phosphate acyltransferase [Anaerolineae bacterium]|nr:1-acyl-sn-glycerol-3-phosphate acyltransferase [Anaerolineae bacterium]